MEWKLSIAGLLIGLLVGITGMGGGSLMTPMLVLLFGFKPTVAIGTDILHGAIFKTFGGIRHRRLGTVHARLTFWMLLASAPMSLAGVAVAEWIERRYGDGVESVQTRILGWALLVCGIGFLVKAFLRPRPPAPEPFLLSRRDRGVALALGAAGGFIVGLTSVGSGTFFALTMLLVFPLAASKIVGTDIFHAAALLWVAGIGHIVGGNIDFGAMGWLLIGSIPGVLLGSQVTVKLPEQALRVALATTLALAGVKLVEVPGDEIILPVTLGVGSILIVAVLLAGRTKRAARPAAGAVGGPRAGTAQFTE